MNTNMPTYDDPADIMVIAKAIQELDSNLESISKKLDLVVQLCNEIALYQTKNAKDVIDQLNK